MNARFTVRPHTFPQYGTGPSWFYVWDSKHKVMTGSRLTSQGAAEANAKMLNAHEKEA